MPIAKTQTTATKWIKWRATDNSSCPVPADTKVEVKFRGMDPDEGRAGEYSWYDLEDEGTIVAYRVVTPSKQEQGWVPWDVQALSSSKGPPELSDDELVEVRLREGTPSGAFAPKNGWQWGSLDGNADREIVSYRPRSAIKLYGWHCTEKSKCPLNERSRIKVRLRDQEEFSSILAAGRLRWSASKGGSADIVEYELVSPADDWLPHDPKPKAVRPCGLGLMVEVRSRDGKTAILRADMVHWKWKLKDRDNEVVAWRKAR